MFNKAIGKTTQSEYRYIFEAKVTSMFIAYNINVPRYIYSALSLHFFSRIRYNKNELHVIDTVLNNISIFIILYRH